MPIRSSFVLFLLVLLLGCHEDSVQPVVNAPKPLAEFVEMFLNEVKLRNINVNASDLVVEHVDSVVYFGRQLCGVGISRSGSRTPKVSISKIYRCWGGQDYSFKKELLFHELGHALLNRLHDNDTLPNGDKKSIMSQTVDGTSIRRGWTKMKYYINELFDPSTPLPDWTK